VRDYVDARWNLGEFFLPIAFVFIFINLFASRSPELALVVLLVLYLLVLVTIVDAFLLWRGLKKRLIAKFGEVPRGTVMYTVMRAFQLRRSRLPRPTSKKHGSWPS
jgi:UDP-N-acetylmuramyl pentapeptide phosphotransferase/UDP-N-acetylglucosamine-1-phosphate transferase